MNLQNREFEKGYELKIKGLKHEARGPHVSPLQQEKWRFSLIRRYFAFFSQHNDIYKEI